MDLNYDRHGALSGQVRTISNESPKRQPEVQTAVEMLEKNLVALDQTIEELEVRLGPIRNAPPETVGIAKESSSFGCYLATNIGQQAIRANVLRHRLRSLITSLEI